MGQLPKVNTENEDMRRKTRGYTHPAEFELSEILTGLLLILPWVEICVEVRNFVVLLYSCTTVRLWDKKETETVRRERNWMVWIYLVKVHFIYLRNYGLYILRRMKIILITNLQIILLLSKEYAVAHCLRVVDHSGTKPKENHSVINAGCLAFRLGALYVDCMHSRSKQRTDQRILVFTLKFLALKKTCFPPYKILLDFCLPLFYATFPCGPYNIFNKKLN
jgi:hypothetical protein